MATPPAPYDLLAGVELGIAGLLLTGSAIAGLYRISHPSTLPPPQWLWLTVAGIDIVGVLVIAWAWFANQVNAVSTNIVLIILVSGLFVQTVYPLIRRRPGAMQPLNK